MFSHHHPDHTINAALFPASALSRPLGDLPGRCVDQPRRRGVRALALDHAHPHTRPLRRGHHHAGQHVRRRDPSPTSGGTARVRPRTRTLTWSNCTSAGRESSPSPTSPSPAMARRRAVGVNAPLNPGRPGTAGMPVHRRRWDRPCSGEATLAKEVPALIETDLELLEASLVVVAQRVTRRRLADEVVLLLHECVDEIQDVVIHARTLDWAIPGVGR